VETKSIKGLEKIGLPEEAKPLEDFANYFYNDVDGKREIYEPIPGKKIQYHLRNVIPIPEEE